MTTEVTFEISRFNPCDEAVKFRSQYNSFKETWDNCPRGDWMLWIAKRVSVDLRTLTKAKALCALTVKHLMKDERSIRACEAALRFADGSATHKELAAAAAAAAAAYAYAAAAAAAAYADARMTALTKSRLETANICRELLTEAVLKKINITHP